MLKTKFMIINFQKCVNFRSFEGQTCSLDRRCTRTSSSASSLFWSSWSCWFVGQGRRCRFLWCWAVTLGARERLRLRSLRFQRRFCPRWSRVRLLGSQGYYTIWKQPVRAASGKCSVISDLAGSSWSSQSLGPYHLNSMAARTCQVGTCSISTRPPGGIWESQLHEDFYYDKR